MVELSSSRKLRNGCFIRVLSLCTFWNSRMSSSSSLGCHGTKRCIANLARTWRTPVKSIVHVQVVTPTEPALVALACPSRQRGYISWPLERESRYANVPHLDHRGGDRSTLGVGLSPLYLARRQRGYLRQNSTSTKQLLYSTNPI